MLRHLLRLVIAAVFTSVVASTAHAAPPQVPFTRVADTASLNPLQLAVGAGSFPGGARLMTLHIDRTAAQVDHETLLAPTAALNKQGSTYAHLHFQGSLFERAELPSLGGIPRKLKLMTTVFPSAVAAGQADAADVTFLQGRYRCQRTPILTMPIPAQTCGWSRPGGKTYVYVVSTVGAVEFVVQGWAGASIPGIFGRTLTDTAFVARREAGQSLHALAVSAPAPRPVVSPPAATPQTLATLSGNTSKQTNTFATSGSFTIAWSAALDSAGQGMGIFSIELDNAQGNELDLLANVANQGTHDSTVEHQDCSQGCFLKVTASFEDYSVTVTK